METWNPESGTDIVEAIEEGKIVRVTESYARIEGLTIIRKPITKKPQKKNSEEDPRLTFEDFRKPLNWQKNQVVSELAENFQWEIAKKRKERGLTRRQFAKAIDETESNIKLLENGILPRNDFIIINKIQAFFNVNLRKDRKDFTQSPRDMLYKKSDETQSSAKEQKENRKEELQNEVFVLLMVTKVFAVDIILNYIVYI